jgi:hypothetical protein
MIIFFCANAFGADTKTQSVTTIAPANFKNLRVKILQVHSMARHSRTTPLNLNPGIAPRNVARPIQTFSPRLRNFGRAFVPDFLYCFAQPNGILLGRFQ